MAVGSGQFRRGEKEKWPKAILSRRQEAKELMEQLRKGEGEKRRVKTV